MTDGNRSDRRRKTREKLVPAKRNPSKSRRHNGSKPSVRDAWALYIDALNAGEYRQAAILFYRMARHPKLFRWTLFASATALWLAYMAAFIL